MIEEQAVITRARGEHVTLEIERATACSLCGQKRGCGNATWGKLLGHDQHSVEVKNTLNAKVGDLVIVGMEEKVLLNAAFLMYLLPLATLLVGALIGHWVWGDDLSVILAALLGLAAGIWVTKRIYQPHASTGSAKNDARLSYAELLRVVGQADDV